MRHGQVEGKVILHSGQPGRGGMEQSCGHCSLFRCGPSRGGGKRYVSRGDRGHSAMQVQTAERMLDLALPPEACAGMKEGGWGRGWEG